VRYLVGEEAQARVVRLQPRLIGHPHGPSVVGNHKLKEVGREGTTSCAVRKPSSRNHALLNLKPYYNTECASLTAITLPDPLFHIRIASELKTQNSKLKTQNS
jgi:hypothetical protein